MGYLSEDEKARIRLQVRLEHLGKRMGIDPARSQAKRLLTKSALATVRAADVGRIGKTRAGRSYAVGIGTKQLAGTVTTGEQPFSGYLSTWDVDTSGDICDPHCFDLTLQDLAALQQRTNARFLMPLLAGHDMTKPVGGVLTATPDSVGLFITAIVDTTTEIGGDIWAGLSHGYNTGLSIGYIPEKTRLDNMGHRIILQATLLEASIVSIPMNSLAVVTSLN